MKYFSFLFVLFMIVIGSESRNIVKRSLVSRFTSNPFFLSHFSGFDDYQDYQSYRPRFVQVEADTDDCYDSEEEEETYKPTFHILKSDDQTNYNEDRNIPVTEEETENNEKPVVVSIFKILPHFEKTHIFQKTKPVQQISQTEKPRVFIFKRLPHFDQIHHFKKTTEAIHKTQPSNIALAYYFNSLPHYEAHYIFREIHEAAPFVSRIKETKEKNEEEGVTFKILPHFNQPKFKDENRRKVKKLVRKKKISKESEVEFGRRLYPKTSVADFPLENIEEKSGLLNSYGELLSQ